MTTKAERLRLVANENASFRKLVTWTDSAGDPVDLTGYTARMQVRRRFGDTAATITLTTENDRITLGGDAEDPTNGEILLEIEASVLSNESNVNLGRIASPKTRFFYDLLILDSAGFVRRLFRGPFDVYAGVTELA